MAALPPEFEVIESPERVIFRLPRRKWGWSGGWALLPPVLYLVLSLAMVELALDARMKPGGRLMIAPATFVCLVVALWYLRWWLAKALGRCELEVLSDAVVYRERLGPFTCSRTVRGPILQVQLAKSGRDWRFGASRESSGRRAALAFGIGDGRHLSLGGGFPADLLQVVAMAIVAQAGQRMTPICPDCGYSLRGVSAQSCPECGRSFRAFAMQHDEQGRLVGAVIDFGALRSASDASASDGCTMPYQCRLTVVQERAGFLHLQAPARHALPQQLTILGLLVAVLGIIGSAGLLAVFLSWAGVNSLIAGSLPFVSMGVLMVLLEIWFKGRKVQVEMDGRALQIRRREPWGWSLLQVPPDEIAAVGYVIYESRWPLLWGCLRVVTRQGKSLDFMHGQRIEDLEYAAALIRRGLGKPGG